MDDLPKEFDLCVIGTGFQESVIAAAASRVGKSVLHIDQNDFYGGFWASFNLENFMNHLDRQNKINEINKACKIRNVTQRWYEFSDEIPEINGWNKEKIEKESRRFNIDLVPKLNYCNGKLVDLLISSNICRYTEFRAVDKVLTARNGQLDIVPSSRADIFTKKNVSIIEKRLLMKFITQCVEYKKEEQKEDTFDFPDDGKFIDLMKQQKLTENLIHYILYSMCMGNSETTFKDGLARIQIYLTSIGRYGNTPYLFPMFGCGEIPQCFCRLCAVFGGIYWLGQSVSDVQIMDSDEQKVIKMKFGEELITAKKLVCGLDSELFDINLHPIDYISRAVFITTSPVGGSTVNSDMDGGGVVLLYHPIEGRSEGVTMIQLSHYTSCISKGLYLIHLSTPHKEGAENDLKEFVETFFNVQHSTEEDSPKPTIIYSAYFEMPSSIKGHNYTDSQDGPIYYCSGTFAELDYDESIRQSRLLYSKMYPDDEFLPKAPEPEEIIIGDEDEKNPSINLGVLADLVTENKDTNEEEKEPEKINIEEQTQ